MTSHVIARPPIPRYPPPMGAIRPVGELLREWRQRRRLSQLDLACEAEISTRHLSFVETGRAVPSREMVLRLAEHLDVPMRERNALLLAAGFAPSFAERMLDDPARCRRRAGRFRWCRSGRNRIRSSHLIGSGASAPPLPRRRLG